MTHRGERKQLRSFGLLVGGIFAGIGLLPTVFRGENPRLWALTIGALLVLPALVVPRSLGPVYRVWMLLGHALGWVNTKIILGMVFYGLITPMAMVMRLFGYDPMRRRFDRDVNTYRVTRAPRSGMHMTRQF